MRKTLLAGAALLLLACGKDSAPPASSLPVAASASPSASSIASAAPPPAASASVAPAPAAPHGVTVIPLKLVTTPAGVTKYGFKTIELRADGAMLLDGKPWSKLTPERVELTPERVESKANDVIFTIGADGALAGSNGGKAQLTPADTITNAVGESFSIADDGTVTFTRKTGEKIVVEAKFESMPAKAKAAGGMMIVTSRIGYVIFKGPKP